MNRINAVFASLAAIAFWCMRLTHIFINVETFMGFAEIVFALMIINSIVSILLAIKNCKCKLFYTSMVMTVIFIIINIFLLSQALSDYGFFIRQFLILAPYLIGLYILIYLIFIYPKTGYHKEKIIGVVMIVAFILIMINSVYSFTPFNFRSRPVVFEAGDQYAIVWTTTSKATGWIEYKDKNTNQIVKVYEEIYGNIVANKTLHRVYVDKEQLDNNTYRAFSKRTIAHYPNNAIMGKTVSSGDINFIGYHNQDDISFLAIADMHDFTKPAVKAVSYLGEYDFVVLLGDIISQINDEVELVNGILKFSYSLTSGTKPIVFARGNHETRGAYANELINYIGLPNDNYNFTLRYGPLAAVVIDTGEDKADDHIEYSGLARYSQYRLTQTEWLKEVESSGFFDELDIEYRIAIGHDPIKEFDTDDIRNEWIDILNRLVSVQLAGHYHRSILWEADLVHNYPIMICGGRKGQIGGIFEATKVTLSNGNIQFTSYNQSGEKVFEALISDQS